MKTGALFLGAVLGAAIVGSGLTAAPAVPELRSRVAVILVDSQKFTDVKLNSWGDNAPELLGQIQKFLLETGERYVPAGRHLEIKVTDIDLAGEFEPWRGPQFDDIRIVKPLYPPRINLEFTLTDAKGAIVSAGKRELTDLAFQMRLSLPTNDQLSYEKDLLRDWFRSEFRPVKVAADSSR